MAIRTGAILALFALNSIDHAQASPLVTRSKSKPCTSFTVPVPIVADQHIYDIVRVDSNIDAVNYELDLDTWDSPSFFERIIDNITISKTYDIHATLCVPPDGNKKNYLQLASHGAGLDSRYWDSEVEPDKYSYVDAVLDAGYSILTYDRLACGQSAKPDAYREVQAPAELEVLRGISEMVRSGKISSGGFSNGTPSGSQFDKIIHVGHSYGSFITYGLTSFYANLSDAVVFTGFLPSNESGSSRATGQDFHYAPEQDPELFADSRSGYIVPGTKNSLQAGFFSSRVDNNTGTGGFDPKLLDYAWSIRQPLTVAELGSGNLLLAGAPSAPEYTGPVQFNIGEYDFLLCAGDCQNTYDPDQINKMFPTAKGVDIHLQPGTGHGLPFHHGAKSGFQATFDWLEKNGL